MYGPPIVVDAAQPAPPRVTIRSSPGSIFANEADQRWLNGIAVWGYPCDDVQLLDPCATVRPTIVYGDEAGDAGASFPAFTVTMAARCDMRGLGSDEARGFRDRLVASFRAVEHKGVERQLERNLLGIANVPSLVKNADGSSTATPAGTAALSPSRALAELEYAIAQQGGSGVIHAGVRVATLWARDHHLTLGTGGDLRTTLGTVVVAGQGYSGRAPGDAAPAANVSWAYATDTIVGRQDAQPIEMPETTAQALDRSSNTYLFNVQRRYVVGFQGCPHAGVPVDLTA